MVSLFGLIPSFARILETVSARGGELELVLEVRISGNRENIRMPSNLGLDVFGQSFNHFCHAFDKKPTIFTFNFNAILFKKQRSREPQYEALSPLTYGI